MAKHHPNIVRRDGYFHYRASFTLDGKIYTIRLSLKTAALAVARERAARMDRILKDRWQQIVDGQSGISEADKASILRATALKVRDGLEVMQAEDQATGYDDADEEREEHIRTIRGLDYVARDIFAHGIGPSFGSYDHFLARFVEGMPELDTAQLARIQEILSRGPLLAAASDDGARKVLSERNIPATSANIVLARRQMMLGALLALREAEAQARAPQRQLNDLLMALEMPSAPIATPAPPSCPIHHVVPAEQSAGDREWSTAPSCALPSTVPTPQATGIGGMTLRQAADAFLAANPKFDRDVASSRWTPKTRSQFEALIFLAGKFFGDDVMAVINEARLAALFRTFRRLPSNHHKTPIHSSMTLEQIAAANTGDGLSLATTNRHMRFLKLVFDWAGKRMDKPPVIDWSAFVEADHRVKRDKRPAFTEGELSHLFEGAIWTGCESHVRRMKPGPHVWHDSPYWVPLLLAYTGARREEVAKAMVVKRRSKGTPDRRRRGTPFSDNMMLVC